MKKLYISIIFCIISWTLNAQTCDTEQYYLTDVQGFSQPPNNLYDSSFKHVFNVRFHIVYNDDGITRTNSNGIVGLDVGFEEVMNAVRDLNLNFNQFNIFFKYYGYDTINNSSYLNLGNTTESVNMRNENNLPDAFNIYVINQISGASAVAGYYGNYSVFDDNYFTSTWTLCHEIGHNFGLLHTFFSNGGECEHAVRTQTPLSTPYELQFNANTTGDQIVDTFPFLHISYSDSNCNYLGGATDCRGTSIVSQTVNGFFIEGSPINNFMTTEPFVSCSPIFTPAQGERMRNAFNLLPDRYDSSRNTIESLYEPYERTRIVEGVKSITDNNDGTANVCRFYTESFKFQKGFDYIFPENESPDANSYVPNDLPNVIKPHFNCPIIIQQLGLVNGEYPVGNALTIDKGFFCETEEWTIGIDIITADLGSYIFTVEEWDKLKVSDPDFYQYLESNKYHIIRKETEKGVILEIVLYKN